jgi:hypothetical protein
MSRLVKLGLVVVCVVAACSSTKDALLRDGGGLGDAQGLDGAHTDPCDGAGAVVRDGSLTCNFGEVDDGGAGGSAGAAGGGVAGTAGASAGSGGAARGGNGGAVAGTGGSAGASGSGGAGGGCGDIGLCARANECVRTCDGVIEYTGCCPCQAPLFDNYGDIACRDMGTPALGYAACSYFGDLGHVTIAKRDLGRDLCVKLVFIVPGTSPSGLSLRYSNPAVSAVPNWGLESYGAGPAAFCTTSGAPPSPGQSISGSMTVTNDTTSGQTLSVSFDVSVTYQSAAGGLKTERINATDLATTASCTAPLPFPW